MNLLQDLLDETSNMKSATANLEDEVQKIKNRLAMVNSFVLLLFNYFSLVAPTCWTFTGLFFIFERTAHAHVCSCVHAHISMTLDIVRKD